MLRNFKYIVGCIVILLICFVLFKYYQFDLFFKRADYHELSQLNNGTLRTLYLNNMINDLDEMSYKEYLFEFNQFENIESGFYEEQLFFRKIINENNSIIYTVGLKGEDYQIGGKKYYYLSKENRSDVLEVNFVEYLFLGNSYDIVLCEMRGSVVSSKSN
ncbi:hypothetical protein BBFL7_02573 [Flavobacteria bacterium BBFL7]|nr:hypothetical protein BBFL7_02573 [Flavobacteria bacterium BBFL7]